MKSGKATNNTEIMTAVETKQPERAADNVPIPTYCWGLGFDYSSTPLHVYIVWPLIKDRTNYETIPWSFLTIPWRNHQNNLRSLQNGRLQLGAHAEQTSIKKFWSSSVPMQEVIFAGTYRKWQWLLKMVLTKQSRGKYVRLTFQPGLLIIIIDIQVAASFLLITFLSTSFAKQLIQWNCNFVVFLKSYNVKEWITREFIRANHRKGKCQKKLNFPVEIPTTVVQVTRVNRTSLACRHESVRSDAKANSVIIWILSTPILHPCDEDEWVWNTGGKTMNKWQAQY